MRKQAEIIFDNGCHVVYKKTTFCAGVFFDVFKKNSAHWFGTFRSAKEAIQRAQSHSLDNYHGFETN